MRELLIFSTDDAVILKQLTGNLGVSTVVTCFMLKSKYLNN